MAPCKLGIKPRARVNSFSWARVKGAAEVNPINSTVFYFGDVESEWVVVWHVRN